MTEHPGATCKCPPELCRCGHATFVTNTEIPEEARTLAAKAIYESPHDGLSREGYERADRDIQALYLGEADAALAAALPALRKQWAEEVARAIEAYRDRPRALAEQLQRSQYGVLTDASELVREYGETTP